METGAYDVTITQCRWRIIHNGLSNQRIQVVKGVPLGGEGGKDMTAARMQLAGDSWESA